ncbi:MAG: hypothetical protein K2N21_01475, partial [Rikenellaceae bacterium]|nr:hypothetical protein [Rikenellaceae bacterium]
MYGGELVAAVMLVIFSLCPPQAPGRSPLCLWLRLSAYVCRPAVMLSVLLPRFSVEVMAHVEYLSGTQPKGQKQLSHKCVRRMSKHIYG